MNRSFIKMFALTICPVFLLSCNNTIEVENQNGSVGGLIPAAIGNYWIYTDSSQTLFDTVSITAKYCSLGYVWWKLQNNSFAMEDFSVEFANRNDSVFGKTSNRGGIELVTPTYITPSDSTINYYILQGCFIIPRKATFYKRAITVPAGTFNQYIAYITDYGNDKDSLVIVPEIGVVCRVFQGHANFGSDAYTVKSFLKSYYLSN